MKKLSTWHSDLQTNKDIFILIKTCPDLKAIHIPGSYTKTFSNSTLMFLEMQNITLLEGDVWGHGKDINKYYEIKPQIIDRIKGLIILITGDIW